MKGWTTEDIERLQNKGSTYAATKFAKITLPPPVAPSELKPPKSGELKPSKQKAETANQITKNVLRVINLQTGCIAYRVNNVGVWDEKKQVRRKGNTEKGLPDVWACIRGRFVVIEVKAGKDVLSDDQKKRRFEVERAKGVYFEARSTDEFLKWFEMLLNG